MNKKDWKKRKEALKAKKYKEAVLDTFDKLESQQKTSQLFVKMAVEIEGKRKL